MNKRLFLMLVLFAISVMLFSVGCEPEEEVTPEGEEAETGEIEAEEPEEEVVYPDPNEDIRFIVPYGAGGGTDVMVRTVISHLEDKVEADMYVTNVSGAGGMTGTMETFEAEPDGYTITSMGNPTLAINYLAGTATVPVHDEMTNLGTVVQDPLAISVLNDSEFESFDDVIEYAKENPGELQWAGVGIAGINPMTSYRIFNEAGIDITYIPYDGAANTRAELLGGHVDLLSCHVSEVHDLAEAGDVRVLVTTGKERSQFYPDVPTIAEVTDSDLHETLFRSFWAPPETPGYVVEYWEERFEELSQSEEFVDQMAEYGYETTFMSSEGMDEYVEAGIGEWETIMQRIEAGELE